MSSSLLKQLVLVAGIGAAFIVGTATAASAHNGDTYAGQDCNQWSARVVLNHNVTLDRKVDVLSTIAGHPGFTGHHYNTTAGQIWQASGNAVAHGGITLNIYRPNGTLEFTDHAILPTPWNCEQPTTTTTIPATTTTTAARATTTTVEPTTTTTVIKLGTPVSVVAPPTQPELPRTGSTSLPLGITAFGMLLAGAGAIAWSRRKAVVR